MIPAVANAICRIRFRLALDGRAISMVGVLDGKNLYPDRRPSNASGPQGVSESIKDYRTGTYTVKQSSRKVGKLSVCGTPQSHSRTLASHVAGSCWTRRSVSSQDGQEGDHQVGVELNRRTAEQFRDGLARIQADAVGTILGHRVVGIDHRDDAACQGNLRAGELRGI